MNYKDQNYWLILYHKYSKYDIPDTSGKILCSPQDVQEGVVR